ncbi:hypothetical protein NR798_07650 [Archangium gephyra]|uniref:hypothetical protein n=1 Tax=Archangium gephyra TaxID=48 RepID=UPI0035D4DD77
MSRVPLRAGSPAHGWRYAGLMETRNHPTLSVRVEGDKAVVELGDYRRELPNLIVLSTDPKGFRKVIAVGEPLDGLRRSSQAGSADAAALLARAEERLALDLQDFRPGLAGPFINYLVMPLAMGMSWWTRRKLRIRIDIAGYDAVTDDRRREFEGAVRRLWRQVLVNGVPARRSTLPWWHVLAAAVLRRRKSGSPRLRQ